VDNETIKLRAVSVVVRKQLDPLQLRYKGSMHTIKTIFAQEGPLAFYNGLAAGCLRAGSIYACRLGTYESALSWVAAVTGCKNTDSISVKLITAMPVTVLSMVVGNPWDVLKVSFFTSFTIFSSPFSRCELKRPLEFHLPALGHQILLSQSIRQLWSKLSARKVFWGGFMQVLCQI